METYDTQNSWAHASRKQVGWVQSTPFAPPDVQPVAYPAAYNPVAHAGYAHLQTAPDYTAANNPLIQSDAQLHMRSPANSLLRSNPYKPPLPAAPWSLSSVPSIPAHPNGLAMVSPIPHSAHIPSPNRDNVHLSALRIPTSYVRYMGESSPGSSTGTYSSPWSSSTRSLHSTPASDSSALPGSSLNTPNTSPFERDAHSFEAPSEDAVVTGTSWVFSDELPSIITGEGPWGLSEWLSNTIIDGETGLLAGLQDLPSGECGGMEPLVDINTLDSIFLDEVRGLRGRQ